MRFRLAPKSTTLDDLEGPYALCFKTHASFGADYENLNEGIPVPIQYYQRRRRSPMILDSGNVNADIRGGSQDLCKFS